MARLRIAQVVGAAGLAGVLASSGCAGAEIQEGLGSIGGVQSHGGDATATDPASGDEHGTDSHDPSGDDSDDDTDDPSDDPTNPTDDPSDPTDDPTGCVAGVEVCNGDDDDCDGEVDEDDAAIGLPCDTGMQGGCGAGVQACTDGQLQCNPETPASAETCNGIDDDCDGTADQGNPGGGGACDTGVPGVCAAGTSQCQSGGIVCVQNVAASSESCNAVDDDCNGVADDGNPGGGGGCSTGLAGICAAGTLQCQGGGLACVQDQGAVGEACFDGLDNDCNGTVDNGCGCAHDTCTAGGALVNGCNACVTSICATDPYCCTTSWDGQCISETSSICGLVCPGSCAHSPCDTGDVLTEGCDGGGCVATICASDPYCCTTSWDGQCVGEVASFCGLTC